jgi:hypothetical protein
LGWKGKEKERAIGLGLGDRGQDKEMAALLASMMLGVEGQRERESYRVRAWRSRTGQRDGGVACFDGIALVFCNAALLPRT